MIVAGIGCRRDCPPEAILALLQDAGPVATLAAPAWKQQEPGLLEAARHLALPIRWITNDALAAVQPLCPTRSATVARAVGLASIAEAAALAGGGTLLRPRYGTGPATCALAMEGTAHSKESPPPLEGGVRGGVPAARGPGGASSHHPTGDRVATPPPSPLPQGEGELSIDPATP